VAPGNRSTGFGLVPLSESSRGKSWFELLVVCSICKNEFDLCFGDVYAAAECNVNYKFENNLKENMCGIIQ
jgi:hypothetical protein